MLASILELWRSRRGRRAAVATITPFVERSRGRLHRIPDSLWLEPYMVGFIAMLITVLAKREVNEIGQPSLALAQCEAWAEITGMSPELIGDRILALCAESNAEFELGCRNALAFNEALTHGSMIGLDDEHSGSPAADVEGDAPLASGANATLSALWGQYFDTRIVTA